jgi:hypothetical protein
LLGTVSKTQRSARGPVYVGRRANSTKFNFTGSIKDVRIYSFALTRSQIAADMRGEAVRAPATVQATSAPPCAPVSDDEDKDLPLAAALLGALAAVACVAAWPSASPLLVLSTSLAAGVLLLNFTAPILPAFNTWMLPLLALVGGASVRISLRRTSG